MREELDFASLPEPIQQFVKENSWCNKCSKADLGIVGPSLYIEDGVTFVEGSCKICGERCVSALEEKSNGE